MPGGNPGCGDTVISYLNVATDGEHVHDLAWVGDGCTISQAAASLVTQLIHDEGWTLTDIEKFEYAALIDMLGRDVVRSRPRCATLALGTLKAAVAQYRRNQLVESLNGSFVDDGFDLNEDGGRREYGIVVGDDAVEASKPACI